MKKRIVGSKKAQITLLIIIGLVVLLIFAIFMFSKKKAEPKHFKIKELVSEIETGALKNHITNCISKAGMDGLKILGENGGSIYDYQGGNVPFSTLNSGQDYLEYDYYGTDYFVNYLLKANTKCEEIKHTVPDYPFSNKLISDIPSHYRDVCSTYPGSKYDGAFGMNVLPKLCYGSKESSCEPFAIENNIDDMAYTFQKQLELFIERRIPFCTNLSAFEERLPIKILTENSPVVDVKIHSSEIDVVVEYPVKIIYEDQEPVVKVLDYQTSLDVRLGQTYNFLSHIASLESRSPDFNLEKDYIISPFWKEGLKIKLIRNACSSCPFPLNKNNIIEVTDTKSLVNGKHFIMRGAIEDRQPVIDWLQSFYFEQDSSLSTNQISFPVNFFDPDDDPLSVFFVSVSRGFEGSGWNEKNNVYYQQIIPNLENKKLSFPIAKKDYGLHELGILVVDETGLFDYQMINATINLSNPVDSKASCLEDCSYEGVHSDSDCEENCWVSQNICWDLCNGNFHTSSSNIACSNCIDRIIDSEKEEIVNCNKPKFDCIDSEPDCFWIKSDSDNDGLFEESCYADSYLSSFSSEAHILLH